MGSGIRHYLDPGGQKLAVPGTLANVHLRDTGLAFKLPIYGHCFKGGGHFQFDPTDILGGDGGIVCANKELAMLLTISTTYNPASDLSFMLHKHPSKVQQVEISAGVAHIFYTEVTPERCTIALLLDIDPIGLVRKEGPAGNDFALEQYVNDRPYVASSLMSAAIAKAFSSALNGKCKDKPELVSMPMPFEARIAVLPVSGGEVVLRKLFEPLGYTLQVQRHPTDPLFPEWGESRYFTVVLEHTITLQQLLSHLYVLIPVCDNDKHYWVGENEVGKLLDKGKDWLGSHPERNLITMRYLKHRRNLANKALETLLGPEEEEEEREEKTPVHEGRLQAVKDEIVRAGAKTVMDLGCGGGKLLRLLLAERGIERLLGMDVSFKSLEIARDKLKLDRLPGPMKDKVQIIQGSLLYRDKRLEGFEAAAMVEVIEHLDETRLNAMEKVVFEYAKPGMVVITTPNAEYNVKFTNFGEGMMRHKDHRFEWTRQEFEAWGNKLGGLYGYDVQFKPLGEADPEVGAISQMAVFKRKEVYESE
jgi:3' terminal RNA ribose 2'-O-methyltransferase Hen1